MSPLRPGPSSRRRRGAAIAAAAALSTGLLAPTASATDGAGSPARQGRTAPLEVALLGDIPYGDAQRAALPALIADVNADRGVRLVLHAGDVKSGSQTCDDARFADLATVFGTFTDPLVLTPGDNDWTDCHRTNNGAYLPTERLDAVRRAFFPVPGRTLGGRKMPVVSQGRVSAQHAAYVENVRFESSRVVFASVHVVGSENDLAPWTTLAGGDRPAERLAEFEARRSANLEWIDAAFDTAERRKAVGVVLMMQAEPVASEGFAAERALISKRAAAFGKPVILHHGDEHVYEVEPAYAGVANLTRLESYGDTVAQWLELRVDPRTPEVFSWESHTVPVPPPAAI